ncbi:ATP-binding protein [Streptomyces sp. NPDC006393]|uniref:ATP-binding protein n=1 Tax=Streptomyces sp. NPDC006393 TaxID=3156763 RepID=UPI003411B532
MREVTTVCPFEVEHTLLGDCPTTADHARRVTRDFLSTFAPQDSAEVDAALIVVSELVTNAIQHAGGVTGFHLRADAETVTICVDDASRTPPRRRQSLPSEPGGFGWPMVLNLSKAVQVDTRSDGKTVRADLPMVH